MHKTTKRLLVEWGIVPIAFAVIAHLARSYDPRDSFNPFQMAAVIVYLCVYYLGKRMGRMGL